MATRNASGRSASGATRGASAKKQVLAMLKADHRKVKKAFKDFEKLDPQDDPQACSSLVERTCDQIEVHAQLEEQLFYPAARNAMDEADLIDEAEVEHMTAKTLIQQLKAMDADADKYAATFKVLGEYIDHHVQEEEGEIFKKLPRTGIDWDALLEDMTERRAALLEEKGMPVEEAAEPAVRAARTGRMPSARATRGEGEARPQAAARGSRSKSEKG